MNNKRCWDSSGSFRHPFPVRIGVRIGSGPRNDRYVVRRTRNRGGVEQGGRRNHCRRRAEAAPHELQGNGNVNKGDNGSRNVIPSPQFLMWRSSGNYCIGGCFKDTGRCPPALSFDLIPDAANLYFCQPCDGPRRGGICQASSWDQEQLLGCSLGSPFA